MSPSAPTAGDRITDRWQSPALLVGMTTEIQQTYVKIDLPLGKKT